MYVKKEGPRRYHIIKDGKQIATCRTRRNAEKRMRVMK